MFFDPLYLVFMIPGLILAGLASLFTTTTFNKYSRVASSSGMTGAQAAQRLLESAGIYNVRIEHINGMLTDHYDPTSRTLRLSDEVYASSSLSAIGVACHEAGHAIQHATNYGPLGMRSALCRLPIWAAMHHTLYYCWVFSSKVRCSCWWELPFFHCRYCLRWLRCRWNTTPAAGPKS